jgi:transcriptional regulator with GAF, ATPase, and Fis domain
MLGEPACVCRSFTRCGREGRPKSGRCGRIARRLDERAIVLLHEFVSRKHFALEWDAANAIHTGLDLGSSNGSFIDGIPARSPTALRDGSVLRLGPAVLVYEAGGAVGDDEATAGGDSTIPGDAAVTRGLRVDIIRAARRASPVLLSGETGSGKEIIAREVHRLSGRTGKLIALNCAALSPQLVESELFGHVRGAFTGAQLEQLGLFREAHLGTLLLDEIGELPLPLQPKLLRVLQEQSVRPVGSTRELAIDVRVVAATNRDLARMVEQGDFRRDLFARLALSEIRVPSLRQRRADVRTWVELFYERFSLANALPSPPALLLDAEVAELLLRRAWPDNLRGVDRLVHAIAERAGAQGCVAPSDLPEWFWEGAAEPVEASAALGGDSPARKPRRTAPSRDELAASSSKVRTSW